MIRTISKNQIEAEEMFQEVMFNEQEKKDLIGLNHPFVLNTPCVTEIKTIEPRNFWRLMFGLNSYNEQDIVKVETRSEYLCSARLMCWQNTGSEMESSNQMGQAFSRKNPP